MVRTNYPQPSTNSTARNNPTRTTQLAAAAAAAASQRALMRSTHHATRSTTQRRCATGGGVGRLCWPVIFKSLPVDFLNDKKIEGAEQLRCSSVKKIAPKMVLKW
jgi:hypothetical protein